MVEYDETLLEKVGLVSPDSSCTLRLNFDENQGVIVKDTSGQLRDGDIIGPVSWVDGRYGKAPSFDDAGNPGDHIRVAHSFSGYTALTLEAWVKTTASEGQNIFSHNPFILHLRGAGFYLRDNAAGNSGYLSWDGYTFNNDTWYHLAATWDGITMTVYINGNEQNSKDWTGSGTLGDSTLLYIGEWFNSGQVSFTGILDNIRVYNRALSGTEIKTQYEQGETKYLLKSVTKPLTDIATLIDTVTFWPRATRAELCVKSLYAGGV